MDGQAGKRGLAKLKGCSERNEWRQHAMHARLHCTVWLRGGSKPSRGGYVPTCSRARDTAAAWRRAFSFAPFFFLSSFFWLDLDRSWRYWVSVGCLVHWKGRNKANKVMVSSAVVYLEDRQWAVASTVVARGTSAHMVYENLRFYWLINNQCSGTECERVHCA